MQGFCTQCGAPLASDARFCTQCGSPLAGERPRPATATKAPTTAAIAIGALLALVGGVAAYFALGTNTDVPRAVPGRPDAPAGGGGGEEAEGLPSGHPSIELPKEVVDFLDGLAADAEKDPKSVEAAEKLAHARYRASVINAAYRAPAEQALQRLLALDPENTDGLRIAANLAYDSGDFAEAEQRFRKFLAKVPDDTSAMTDFGSTLLFQDKTDEAIAEYRAAIAKDPKFMQAHFNLGIALEKKGDKAAATASLHEAMDLAGTPDERQHVENALAELEGREPQRIAGASTGRMPVAEGGAPGGGMPAGAPGGGAPAGGSAPAGGMMGGMAMPPPAPERAVPTNATTAFQHDVEKMLVTHPIVGPRVVSFQWNGPSTGSVRIADFPMDRMPPFARAKFKQGMADKLADSAAKNAVTGAAKIDLVDDASGNVMDTLEPASAGAAAPAGGAAK